MMLGPDFFDYEKNLSHMLSNKSKIEIYTSPNRKSLRKKNEYEKSINNSNNIYNIKKADSLSLYEKGQRGYSFRHRIRRNNDTDLIISDISKDEVSDNSALYNIKSRAKLSGFKRGKSFVRLNSSKRNTKSGKKVSFKNSFVEIIQVESYKKYNIALYDNADAKCSCLIC